MRGVQAIAQAKQEHDVATELSAASVQELSGAHEIHAFFLVGENRK